MSTLKIAPREERSLRRRLVLLIAALALLVASAAAWSWSPLQDRLDTERIVDFLHHQSAALGPIIIVCGFSVAVAIAVPLTFLILVAILALGPWSGSACALAGALIGASVSYGVGMLLGREVVRRLGGQRVNDISRRLAARGLLAVIAVRMVPIAPFAVVNMIAGASHIHLRDFLLGTAIGMLPSMLFLMLFVDQITLALTKPGPLTLFLLALTLALIGLGVWGMRRWLRRNNL